MALFMKISEMQDTGPCLKTVFVQSINEPNKSVVFPNEAINADVLKHRNSTFIFTFVQSQAFIWMHVIRAK